MIFLIPLGHEATWVRRIPFVTFTFIGIMILMSLVGFFAGAGQPIITDSDKQTLAEIFYKYPCTNLEPGDWESLEQEFPRAAPFLNNLRKELTNDKDIRWAACESFLQGRRNPSGKEAVIAQIRKVAAKFTRDFYSTFGFIPGQPRLLTLITHMFVHAGLLHLLGNLIFFWVSSYALEDIWGRVPFIILFLTSGLAAVFFYAQTTHNPDVPLVGASGAIAGLMGAFFVRMGHVRIKMLLIWWALLRGGAIDFWIKAKYFLGFWFIREMLNFLLFSNLMSGIAYAAHLGGFAWGVFFALAIRKFQIETKILAPRIQEKIIVAKADPQLIEAGTALDDGNFVEARRLIQQYLTRVPDDSDGWMLAFVIARRIPDYRLCQVVVERLVEKAAAGQDWLLDAVLEHMEDCRPHFRPTFDPRALNKVVSILLQKNRSDQALTILEWDAQADNTQPPSMILRWVRLYMERGWWDKALKLMEKTRNRWDGDPLISDEASKLYESIQGKPI